MKKFKWTKEALERLDREFNLGGIDPDSETGETYLKTANVEIASYMEDGKGNLLKEFASESNHSNALKAIYCGLIATTSIYYDDMRETVALVRGQSEEESKKYTFDKVEYIYAEYFRKAYARACKAQKVEKLGYIW